MLKLIKELPSHWVLSGLISLFCAWMYLRSFASPVGFGFYLLFFLLSAWALLSMKRALNQLGFYKAKVWFNYVILAWSVRFVLEGALLTAVEIVSLGLIFMFGFNLMKKLSEVKKSKRFDYSWHLVDSLGIWAFFVVFMSFISVVMLKHFELTLVIMEMLNFVFICMFLMLFGRFSKPQS